MSSKIRLDDLPFESLDDIEESFSSGIEPERQKRNHNKKRKRKMIEDYMEERNLKRNLSDGYDLH